MKYRLHRSTDRFSLFFDFAKGRTGDPTGFLETLTSSLSLKLTRATKNLYTYIIRDAKNFKLLLIETAIGYNLAKKRNIRRCYMKKKKEKKTE